MELDYKSKKQQIIDLCDYLEFPVFFPDDIRNHDNKLILKRSDGYELIYTISVRPKLINDNTMIELETKLQGTGIKNNLNNTNSF